MTQVEQGSPATLEPAQRRALRILKQRGMMTASQFATAMLAEMPGTAANECLEELRQIGLVEVQMRTVGPVRYGLTPEGIRAAWA